MPSLVYQRLHSMINPASTIRQTFDADLLKRDGRLTFTHQKAIVVSQRT